MNISKHSATALLVGLSILLPSFAFAQVGASVQVEVGATTTVRTAVMTQAITRANQEIDRRSAALQKLNTRIQAMRKVTDEFKANLNSNIQMQLSGLTALKAQINAATDAAALRSDVQTITQAYRIYALIMPQAAITAAADRIVVVVDMMVGVGNKLQARIEALAQTGVDVTALQASLAEFGVALATAQTEAQLAVNGSAGLSPDNGDAKVMASNTAALKAARTDLQDARAALVKARQNITALVNGLKSLQVNTSVDTQVQVQ